MKKTRTLAVLAALLFVLGAQEVLAGGLRNCGDINSDGTVNIADISAGVAYFFADGLPPADFDTADADGFQLLTLHDLQEIANCIFLCDFEGDCTPTLAAMVAVPDSRFKFGYDGEAQPASSKYSIRFGLVGDDTQLESFLAPLKVTFSGMTALIDSVVFNQDIPTQIRPFSVVNGPGSVTIGLFTLVPVSWDYGFIGTIYLAQEAFTFAPTVGVVWDTLSPTQAPLEQLGALYPLFNSRDFDAQGFLPDLGPYCCWVAGDFNYDGSFNIADITAGIAHIFSGGVGPFCPDAADTNGDNSFNVGDVTYGIQRIFAGGPEPICGTTAL